VNKLPPTLVAAFRATLEELADADLLVHVADVTHPNLHEHMRVVDETLKSLDLQDRPRLLVLNQADRLRGEEGDALREALGAEFPAAVFTSALKGEGLEALRALAPGGRLMLVAINLRQIQFDAYADVITKERRIIGCSDHTRDELIELMQMKLDLSRAITRRAPLEANAINDVLDELERGTPHLRTIITI